MEFRKFVGGAGRVQWRDLGEAGVGADDGLSHEGAAPQALWTARTPAGSAAPERGTGPGQTHPRCSCSQQNHTQTRSGMEQAGKG